MRRITGLWVLALSIPFSAHALTLDGWAAMQTLLRAKVSGVNVCPEAFRGVSATALATLPMLLEGRIRGALEALASADRDRLFSAKHLGDCRVRCRCGIYADWIGDEPARVELRKRLLAVPEPKVEKCAAANAPWICKHPAFRALVAEGVHSAKGSEE